MAEENKINNNDAENRPASDRDILENEIVRLGEGPHRHPLGEPHSSSR